MIPDSYDMWEHREIELELQRVRRPVCEDCGEHIQDETAFLINGCWFCEKCMDNYREIVEDYIE